MKLLRYLRNLMLPVHEINQSLPSSGLIYEIGCGYGSLSFEIASHSTKRQVIGIDTSRKKIGDAQREYLRPNLNFFEEDAKRYKYKRCSGVILSDFLHHIDWSSQLKILDQVIGKLEKGGILILKEIVKDDGWRMWLSRLWDFLLYPKDKIYYRNLSDWKNILTRSSLQVDAKRQVPWFPGSTILFVCKR